MFMTTFVIIARKWKQPQCLWIDKWINEMWYIHTMECSSAITRNEVLLSYHQGDLRKCYAKSKKPITEERVLRNCTSLKCPE